MKKFIIAAVLLSAAAGAMAQNVTMQLGQTGYYGSIDLGNLRAPPVIYQQPMIIEQMPQYRNAAPMYMRVPPGHARKWSKHCAAYNACGRPVYFVQDSWYNNTYAPQYRKTHGGGRKHDDDRRGGYDDGRHHDKHEDKGHKNKGHKDKGHHDKGHGNGKH
jgi:hypothetical protein